jgi:hypothetical protein
VTGAADAIVSGEHDRRELGPHEGMWIQSPAQFPERWRAPGPSPPQILPACEYDRGVSSFILPNASVPQWIEGRMRGYQLRQLFLLRAFNCLEGLRD